MSVRVYLVVDGHGDCRLTKRRPSLDWDEVAFPIIVQVPQGWGRVYEDRALELKLPEPPEPSIALDEPEVPASWDGPNKMEQTLAREDV
jgi:hypothetical protein